MGCDGRIGITTGIGQSAAGMAALFYARHKNIAGIEHLDDAVSVDASEPTNSLEARISVQGVSAKFTFLRLFLPI